MEFNQAEERPIDLNDRVYVIPLMRVCRVRDINYNHRDGKRFLVRTGRFDMSFFFEHEIEREST